MNYVHVHVCTISTAATDDLSRDEPGSTVSGTSSATKSTRLTSNTKPKATGALVKSSKAKKGIYNFKSKHQRHWQEYKSDIFPVGVINTFDV